MSPNDRLSQFKNHGKDLESSRNRRKEDVVELRKARKDEQLSKRRNVHLADELSDLEEFDNNNPMGSVAEQSHLNQDIEKLVKGLYSSNIEEAFQCTQMARKVLSKEKNPPIDKLISLNAVPRLVELLQHDERPDLEFEAAWALTNIASGSSSQTECVVNAGSCPHFLRLLGSPAQNVAEQAIWALANIAGEGPHYRDMLISIGVIPAITRLVTPNVSGSFLANVAWCLSNLCRNKNPPPCLSAVRECLPTIRQLLFHDNPAVIPDACWSLSYISDGSDDRIQEVINLDVIDRLIAILQSSNDRNLVMPTMRTLGNIVTGTDDQTQVVIDHGGLAAFKYLLRHHSLNLHKEVAWALSNVTAGPKHQIQAVIDNGLLNLLIELLNSPEVKVRKEATWAICNLTCSGTIEQINAVISGGALPPLVHMLTSEDPKITQVILDAIKNIVKAAEAMDQREAICEAFEELGLLDHLERLQTHGNDEIYSLAVRLIEEFWGSEDDEDILIPNSNADGTEFDFNPGGAGSNIQF